MKQKRKTLKKTLGKLSNKSNAEFVIRKNYVVNTSWQLTTTVNSRKRMVALASCSVYIIDNEGGRRP